jgi:CHASE3 domain sensor protein
MEQQVVKAKQQLGEVVNVISESGGEDLMEKVYQAMNLG